MFLSSMKLWPRNLKLGVRQTPVMLRVFHRRPGLIFANYGMGLLLLFLACFVVSGRIVELQRLLSCAVLTLTVMAGGVYGVGQGIWRFFSGPGADRCRRATHGSSALIGFCISRFIVVYVTVLLQLLLLSAALRSELLSRLVPLLAFTALACAVLVIFGLFLAVIVSSWRQAVLVCNAFFILLAGLVMGGIMAESCDMPSWLAAIGGLLPSLHMMQGYQALLVGTGNWGELVCPSLWLVGTAAVLAPLVLWRFNWRVLGKGMIENWDE